MDGTLKKEYNTPKRIPKPDNETDDPTINRINSDFLFGVDWILRETENFYAKDTLLPF